MSDTEHPKTFISYSWTDTKHEEWVLDLARNLREHGVDVVIDKWDLEEGQDMLAFMERMVTDPDMDKVLIVCDEEYAQKADQREGGVGTETQIVSKDLYDEVDPEDPQKKFAAIIAETDEEGKPYLPTYMKNRIYFDMSTPEARADNFERLVRWLYGKPQEEKPPLGEPPAHLLDEDGPRLGTSSRALQVKRKLREGNPAAVGAVRDYFETFAGNLERFELETDELQPSPEKILQSIEDFLPFRDEAIDVFVTLANYWPGEDGGEALHSFFERLMPYIVTRQSQDTSADNFAFIVRELFLYAVAALLQYRRYKAVGILTKRGYYLDRQSLSTNPGTVSFTGFRSYVRSIEDHLNHDHSNKTADLLKDRAQRQNPTHDDIMQADLVLYLRSEADQRRDQEADRFHHWYPDSLLYARRHTQPFEFFSRASREESEEVWTVLGLSGWDDFRQLIQEIGEDPGFPTPGRWPLNVPRLVGIEQ
jgi:hypothetical protein